MDCDFTGFDRNRNFIHSLMITSKIRKLEIIIKKKVVTPKEKKSVFKERKLVRAAKRLRTASSQQLNIFMAVIFFFSSSDTTNRNTSFVIFLFWLSSVNFKQMIIVKKNESFLKDFICYEWKRQKITRWRSIFLFWKKVISRHLSVFNWPYICSQDTRKCSAFRECVVDGV